LLLVTGLVMVFIARFPLTIPLVGLLGYTPTLRRQIQLLESEGFQSPNYQVLARRGIILGVVLAVLVIAIVFLMVVKPGLWA
jgi:uncharacterized membrane protein